MNSIENFQKKEPLFLHLKAKTWNRDSHGLFDYENNAVKTNTFSLLQTGFIIRRKNEVKYLSFLQDDNFNETEDKELFKILTNNNKFYLHNKIETNLNINNDTLTDLQEKIWHVIKSNNSNNNQINTINNNFISNYQYCLKKNDIIKLGRIKFIVREISIIGTTVEKTQEIFKNYIECSFIDNHESNICRICLQSTSEESNPMISICKCKGSMNIIHLKCLKVWLDHKLTTKEMTKKAGISYTVKAYNCEICKEPYPISIRYNGTSYNLLNYVIPEQQNFVILESLNSIKENQYPLSIHILLFCDNDFYILGRGHDSDVRISDISVSRVHSKIYLQDNKLYLEDCGSKFGTLVLAKDELEINEDCKIIQIGRTLVSTYISNNSTQQINQNESKIIVIDNKQNANNINQDFLNIIPNNHDNESLDKHI